MGDAGHDVIDRTALAADPYALPRPDFRIFWIVDSPAPTAVARDRHDAGVLGEVSRRPAGGQHA